MPGALLGSESVCQPACKCAWKSQPSLSSLPWAIQTLPQQVFWSTAAAEKALLMFRAMKMLCVHISLWSVRICGCWLGKNICPVCCLQPGVQLQNGEGSLGDHLPGKQCHLLWGLRTTRHS